MAAGVIDIGSNSVRLKIASVEQHRLRTLHEDREVVRLGESVFQTGVISPEAMANAIRALNKLSNQIGYLQRDLAQFLSPALDEGAVSLCGEVSDSKFLLVIVIHHELIIGDTNTTYLDRGMLHTTEFFY